MHYECQCGCERHDWDEPEPQLAPSNRAIRPLPFKRLRAAVKPGPANGLTMTSSIDPSAEASAGESEGEDARAPVHVKEAAAYEAEGAGEGGYDEDEVIIAPYDRWPRQNEPFEVSRDPDRSAQDDSGSPPGSPASTTSSVMSARLPVYEQTGILFGDEGKRIVDSLATASSFSSAGLFGGLGLATLHPALTPAVAERHYEEDDDGDEDTYGIVDRSRPPVEPSPVSQAGAAALVTSGSNKKKRKIPGMLAAQNNDVDDASDYAPPVESSQEVSIPVPGAPAPFRSSRGDWRLVAYPSFARALTRMSFRSSRSGQPSYDRRGSTRQAPHSSPSRLALRLWHL